jgi:hypothetical protein
LAIQSKHWAATVNGLLLIGNPTGKQAVGISMLCVSHALPLSNFSQDRLQSRQAREKLS